jgi:UTP:GlnB (protein PII) uridylyltransferase
MLKKRLLSILPSTEQHIHQFYIWKEELMTHLEQQQFILQVTSYDRMGYLHDLVNALFECELACAKAHITTSPSNGVLDVFWICDYRKELPQERRCEEIIATLKKTLGQPDANISISTPTQDSDQPDSHSVSVRRTACKDAKPTQTLRQRGHSRSGSNESLNFGSSTWGDAEQQRSMDGVKVSLPLPYYL